MHQIKEWLTKNWDDLLQQYPESKPLLAYFQDYFSTSAGKDDFIDSIRLAIHGTGVSIQEVAGYSFEDDETNIGGEREVVTFYFCGEHDGEVTFKTFALVFEIVASAYAELYPNSKDKISQLLPRFKRIYGI